MPEADKLPFRRDADASFPAPEGVIPPFREGRGQAAEGGRDIGPVLGGPNALGHGNTFPARLKG